MYVFVIFSIPLLWNYYILHRSFMHDILVTIIICYKCLVRSLLLWATYTEYTKHCEHHTNVELHPPPPSIHQGKDSTRCRKFIAVLDSNQVHLAPSTIHHSKALKYLVLPIHPLNNTHTQPTIVLRLKNIFITWLLPFIYTDWSGFNRWHQ